MTGAPMVSVIVPVYGAEAYLADCLDSLLGQTLREIELLLIDDGSPDNGGAICDAYAERDARIRVLHQQNAGVSAARNAGVAMARGAWLGFVDSDDTAEPAMFENLLSAAKTADAQIAVCGYIERKGAKDLRHVPEPGVFTGYDAMVQLVCGAEFKNFSCNKLFDRRLFGEDLRYPTGVRFEEIPLMYRLFERAARVAVVPDCLYVYLQHPGSLIGQRRLADELYNCEGTIARLNDLSARHPALADTLLFGLFDPVVKHAVFLGLYNSPAAHRACAGRKRAVTAFLRQRRAALAPLLSRFDRGILALLLRDSLPLDYLAAWLCAGQKLMQKLLPRHAQERE